MDPKVSEISPDTPVRLEVALKAAFPAGGITIAGLRKEIAKGRLQVELIAGKHFTTLAAIQKMRELCRLKIIREVQSRSVDPQISKAALLAKLRAIPSNIPKKRKLGS